MFFELDGFPVPVSVATPKRNFQRMGRRQRSGRGQLRDSRFGVRQAWDMTACFLRSEHTWEDAEAFVGMLQPGESCVWGMRDGLAGSTGLSPMPGYGTLTFQPGAAGAFPGSPGRIHTDAAHGTELFRIDIQARQDEWTVGGWVSTDGASWNFYALRGDSFGIENLTENDLSFRDGGPAPFYVVENEGAFSFVKNGAGDAYLDDLFIRRFRATVPMLNAWADLTKPLGPLPVMRATGDMIREDWAYCATEPGRIQVVSKSTEIPNFGWVNNALLVSFSAFLIADRYVLDDQIPGFEKHEESLGPAS